MTRPDGCAGRYPAHPHPQPNHLTLEMTMTTPTPTGTLRDRIATALSAAGAFCGSCGFEPGDRGKCADCERCWSSYADALMSLIAAEREAGRRAGMAADTATTTDGHGDGLPLGAVQERATTAAANAYQAGLLAAADVADCDDGTITAQELRRMARADAEDGAR